MTRPPITELRRRLAAEIPSWRDLAAAVRDIPEFLVDGLERFALRLHAPVDAGDGQPVCRTCRRLPDWPCEEFLRVQQARDERLR